MDRRGFLAATRVWLLGPYKIVSAARFDNPAFSRHTIYRDGKFLGCQFSVPSESDCAWFERGTAQYAESSKESTARYGYVGIWYKPKRGRPKKGEAERELQEAIADG
mgnify:CR=1 FL=1